MRIVNYRYLKEAYTLNKKSGYRLSNRRLRRLAYFDVYFNDYTSFELYNTYKKTVNSDASNNQIMVIILVVAIIAAVALLLLFT